MNEQMIIWLENDWLLYLACGAAAVGCLIQLILSAIYRRSLNASDRMRNTKVAWLRQMKTRYESGYEWNNRIRNVELFVDKHLGRRKWLGIYLKTWEELGRMMLLLVLALSALGAVYAGSYLQEKNEAFVYLVTGAGLAFILRGLTLLVNLKEKQNMLRTNLCDYFENTLRGETKNRRREKHEQEKYYGLQEQREEIACTETEEQREPETVPVQNEGVSGKKIIHDRKQRRAEKLQKKLAKKEERAVKKQSARLHRRQVKEQKRVDKLTRRMEKMQKRLGTVATLENAGNKKDDCAKLKREQLKRKVDVTPAQEDRIIADVLREFLV